MFREPLRGPNLTCKRLRNSVVLDKCSNAERSCVLQGKCTFGPRLSDIEIQGLSQFVVDKAEQGWQ